MLLTDEILAMDGLTTKDEKRCAKLLSNWLVLHPHIKELPETEDSMRELVLLMFAEMHRPDRARYQILDRLYRRYKAIRAHVEYARVMSYAG